MFDAKFGVNNHFKCFSELTSPRVIQTTTWITASWFVGDCL